MNSNNINPELFSITAIIVGLIIEGDYTSDELNSIGNWLILVGQITLTTAAQQQLINNKFQKNEGSRIKSDAGNHSLKNVPLANINDLEELKNKIDSLERRLSDNQKR